jgi:hypothetical protein
MEAGGSCDAPADAGEASWPLTDTVTACITTRRQMARLFILIIAKIVKSLIFAPY